MEENKNGVNVTINISGGNNIVQPTATQATQVFNGDQFVPQELKQQQNDTSSVPTEPTLHPSATASSEMPDDAIALRKYVDDEKRLKEYVEDLSKCADATALAMVVVKMYRQEENLLDFEIKKERFIKIVLNLAPHVKTGNTISNIRMRIKNQLNLIDDK